MSEPSSLSETDLPEQRQGLAQSTLGIGLLGSALLWLAQPPVSLSLLAWVAPVPWVWLVARDELRGRRAWLSVWLAGAVYWMAATWWVVLPHPLTPIGLPFLGGYLGCYPLLFVALSRVGHHRLKMPLWLVVPVVWTGLEWVQAHLFTGFLMGALSHSQAWSPRVIQIAEYGGAYAVSFVIMAFAAGMADGLLCVLDRRSGNVLAIDNRPPVGFFTALLPLALTLFIGHFSLQEADRRQQPGPTVALIQGDTRATWDPDPSRKLRIMEEQIDLSLQSIEIANEQGKEVDLMIWPESMFRLTLATYAGSVDPPASVANELAAWTRDAPRRLVAIAKDTHTPLLVGIDHIDVQPPFEGDPTSWNINFHNSAALTDSTGAVTAIYAKMHRVPFGEYIPLFDNMPALYFLTPLPRGLSPGLEPVGMPLETTDGASIMVSPNICYETVIPHVIRNQVRALSTSGTPTDLMVNVTNNAWFWGSSELEMHLACNIFRAVENRTPLVVAANGGLSAAIDSSGRVIAVGERMKPQVVLAEVPLDPRESFYMQYGDLLAWGCLIVCIMLAIIGVLNRKRKRHKAS